MADTQLIKDRLDIIQLIQEYVPLKKAGANWKGRCPFHQEKTPSFMVHPEKQIWHCFGCHKGGDIFSFIQAMESLEFIEALKLLAERAGVKIDSYQSELQSSQRNRLLQINEAAAHFFHRFLLELTAAGQAREYLTKRGLQDHTIKDWQLGFAPEQWDLLTQYLLKKGYGIDDLVASGLTIKREGADAKSSRGFYDRFRGRIMFPLSDVHGTIVGFTGRLLKETPEAGGKYVNTPQTTVYDKSRLLYGLDKAKTEIKNQDLAVLVEGQMDVLACHQAGMKNVVAASGTALTVEQLKLLQRYTSSIAMAFDADSAGEAAGKRGAALALESGLRVRVIQLPPGGAKDADECLRQNPAAWWAAVAAARPVLEWYFNLVLEREPPRTPEAKQQAAETLLREIGRVPYAVERDEWLRALSARLGVELSALRELLRSLRRQEGSARAAPSALAPPAPAASSSSVSPPDPLNALLTECWSWLIKFPHLANRFLAGIPEEYYVDTAWPHLYQALKNLYHKENQLSLEALRQAADIAGKENPVDVLLLRPMPWAEDMTDQVAEGELLKLIERLNAVWKQRQRAGLTQAIATAEAQGEPEKVKELLRELQQL